MPSQLLALPMLEAEFKRDPDGFRESAVGMLLPSAVLGTAKAARGEEPFRVPQRWACLAGLRVAGWLKAKTELSVAFLIAEQLGVKTIEDSTRLLESAKRAHEATADDALQLAEQLVSQRIKADPDYRRRSMQRLYGLIDGGSASVIAQGSPNGAGVPSGPNVGPNVAGRGAQVASRANGNGHANGNGGHS